VAGPPARRLRGALAGGTPGPGDARLVIVDPTARRDITGAGQQRLARYEHRRDEYIRQLAHLAPRLPEEQKARLAVLLAPAIRQVFGGDRHA